MFGKPFERREDRGALRRRTRRKRIAVQLLYRPNLGMLRGSQHMSRRESRGLDRMLWIGVRWRRIGGRR